MARSRWAVNGIHLLAVGPHGVRHSIGVGIPELGYGNPAL
jgi:hypothetical protein